MSLVNRETLTHNVLVFTFFYFLGKYKSLVSIDSKDGACFLCDVTASAPRDSKPYATSRFTRVSRRPTSILSPCSRKTFVTAVMNGEPFVDWRNAWKPKRITNYMIYQSQTFVCSHSFTPKSSTTGSTITQIALQCSMGTLIKARSDTWRLSAINEIILPTAGGLGFTQRHP